MVLVIIAMIGANALFAWLDRSDVLEVLPIMEKAKQDSLADPRFNELYREGKRMTGMGDNR